MINQLKCEFDGSWYYVPKKDGTPFTGAWADASAAFRAYEDYRTYREIQASPVLSFEKLVELIEFGHYLEPPHTIVRLYAEITSLATAYVAAAQNEVISLVSAILSHRSQSVEEFTKPVELKVEFTPSDLGLDTVVSLTGSVDDIRIAANISNARAWMGPGFKSFKNAADAINAYRLELPE